MSRDGSIERKDGDYDEHVRQTIDRESIVPSAKLPNSRNHPQNNLPAGIYNGLTENLIESKAYFSNDPHHKNIGKEMYGS